MGSTWIFRGQRNATHSLKATAWRDGIEAHPQFKQAAKMIAGCPDAIKAARTNFAGGAHPDDILRRLLVQRCFEHNLVHAFASFADQIGFRIPGGLPQPYTSMLKFAELPAPPSDNPFHPATALAQHHGIQTRLLDWSLNPLIAAFFAACDVEDGETGNVAIWAFNPTACSNGALRVFHVDRGDFQFLHAQEGLFTYIADADCYFLSCGTWPSLEGRAAGDCMVKVTLPKNQAREARRLLFAERISFAHLMPTHDNVAEVLRDMWQVSSPS